MRRLEMPALLRLAATVLVVGIFAAPGCEDDSAEQSCASDFDCKGDRVCDAGVCVGEGQGGDVGETEICRSMCVSANACDGEGEADECTAGCVDYLDDAQDVSTACGEAVQGLFSCLADLDCDEFSDYATEPTPNYPCNSWDDAVDSDCDEPSTGPSTGGGSEPEPEPDPNACSGNSDCGSRERCRSGQCQSVECTSDSHCGSCSRCSDNVCRDCGYGPYGCYC